jgi:type IV pilus assembly protein PilY1
LAHVNSFVTSYKNGLVDAVYAGDLLGNVWRFDMDKAGTLSTYPAPVKIAQLQTGGKGQPITFAPAIEIDKATQKRYVFVSTGKLLANSDILDSQTQSFYAIADGTSNQFFNATTLPSTITYPIERNEMNDDTSTISTGIGRNPANTGGWYVDFPVEAGIGYKGTTNISTGLGTVLFAASRVTLDDPCEPVSTFRGYGLAFGTGASNIQQAGTDVNFVTGDGLANDAIMIRYNDSGTGIQPTNTTLPITDSTGSIGTSSGTFNQFNLKDSSILGFKPLNWREIPNVD